MRRSVMALGAILFLLASSAVLPAHASVVERLTLDDLHGRADLVATASVLRSRGVMADGRIETETVLRVDKVWRGPRRKTVKVRTPGGVIGDVQARVAGSPSFRLGETVLVFLRRNRGEWRTVGLFQGVWTLSSRSPGLAIPSSTGGAAFLESTEGGPYAWQPHATSLDRLVGRLEEVRR